MGGSFGCVTMCVFLFACVGTIYLVACAHSCVLGGRACAHRSFCAHMSPLRCPYWVCARKGWV